MKICLPAVLAPVLVGCAHQSPEPKIAPVQEVVATLIQAQIPVIRQAQAELAQASRVSLTSPPAAVNTARPGTSPRPAPQAGEAGRPVDAFQAIRYLGDRPATLPLAPAGRATTLRQALRHVVPAGWQLVFSQTLQPDARVSLQWRGNDQWPFVLDRILRQQGKVALIDWRPSRISVADRATGFTPGGVTVAPTASVPVSAAPATTPQGRNPFRGAAVSSPLVMKPTPTPVWRRAPGTTLKVSTPAKRNPFTAQDVTAPTSVPTVRASITSPAVADPARLWVMTTGSTLKDSLMIWAAEETCTLPTGGHWTVQWLTPVNYRIDAPLVFKGRFMDALNDVFRLYLNASVPLYAGTRLEQCQVVVSDKEPQ